MTDRRLELVVCAAPLARRAHAIVAHLIQAGWQVNITTSLNAADWIDADALALASTPPAERRPGEPRPSPASGVVLAPATFNTLNKLRAGISDTPALGVLNDAVGQRLPLLVVPMLSTRLVAHPAWPETVDWLRRLSVTLLDPTTGRAGVVGPLGSGTGDAVTDRFDPAWITAWANALPQEAA